MSVITRPSIFISSTVYDFHDLRSALKFWLSELGYDVMLSDVNDFPKALDENSYESCIKAISKADYFILLIGSRVGGLYNKKDGLSITRMEYREAVKQMQVAGKPKIAVFVRRELWDIREDRSALTAFLREEHANLRELTQDAREQLANHPSKFVNDAESIFAFIKEVGQVDQMKLAVDGVSALPQGNWIHRFSTFADIADALRIALGVSSHVERKVLAENLKQELLRNMTHLLTKSKSGGLIALAQYPASVVERITGGPEDKSKMTVGLMTRLIMFRVLSGPVPARLSRLFIERAAESGMYMNFDAATATYQAAEMHIALLELLSLIMSAQQTAHTVEELTRFSERFKPSGRHRDTEVEVSNLEIAIPCGEAKEFARITELTIRLIQHLDGKRGALNLLSKWSPGVFPDDADQLDAERLELSEALEWVRTRQ